MIAAFASLASASLTNADNKYANPGRTTRQRLTAQAHLALQLRQFRIHLGILFQFTEATLD